MHRRGEVECKHIIRYSGTNLKSAQSLTSGLTEAKPGWSDLSEYEELLEYDKCRFSRNILSK